MVDCIKNIKEAKDLLQDNSFEELQSTIEGSKGLIVPNLRKVDSENTKAYAANQAENPAYP